MTLFSKSGNPLARKFAANTGWIVAQYVFQYILSAVIGIIAARYMGPANYGILGYGAALIVMISPFCTLAINGVLIPCMIEAPEDTGKIIGSGLVMRLVSTTFSILGLLLYVRLARPGESLLLFVTFLQALQLFFQALDCFRLWFQMKLMSKYPAIASIIGNIACSAWRIFLLARGSSVEWFALTSTIQMAANYLFLLPMFARLSGIRIGFSWDSVRRIWRRGGKLILADLTVVISTRIGSVMLSNLLGDAPLGIYNAAYNIAMMWIFVPQAFIESANPLLLETNAKNPDAFWPRYQFLFLTLFGISLAAGIGLSALAPLIIRILYGSAYSESASILRIVAWVGLFSSIGSSRNIWTQAKNKQKYVVYFCIVSAVASIVLNYVLIRSFGAAGAGLAIVLVNAVQSLGAPLLFSGSREFVEYWLRSFSQIPGLLRMLKDRIGGSK